MMGCCSRWSRLVIALLVEHRKKACQELTRELPQAVSQQQYVSHMSACRSQAQVCPLPKVHYCAINTASKHISIIMILIQIMEGHQDMIPSMVAAVLLVISIVLFMWNPEVGGESVEVKLIKLGFAAGKHLWQDSENTGLYNCNVCKGIMVSGMKECQKCGLLVHSLCRIKRKPHCKYVSSHQENAEHLHQWLEGNLPINALCAVCGHLCAGLVSIDCYRCMWCQRAVHQECRQRMGNQCDFGRLKKWIIEPGNVKSYQKHRKRKKASQNSESEEEHVQVSVQISKEKNPIIVIINKKSGGQLGSRFLKQFYYYLNPIQVINFPVESLQIINIFMPIPGLRILVGGGDGTICAVANYVKELCKKHGKDNPPPIATLPLGTGNDLSRSLGWGHDYEQFEIQDLFGQISGAERVQMDRWQVEVLDGQKTIVREFKLYNYLGIGLDAKYCMQFHQLRESYPRLFFSQFSNKLIYSQMGAFDLIKKKLNQSNEQLQSLVTITLDGKELDLSELENVVVMNIQSWGGGVQPWKTDSQRFSSQSFSDRMLEVFGIENVLHMGQVQLDLDQVVYLGQGRELILTMKEKRKLHVQFDGQPIKLHGPFSVRLFWHDQVPFLTPQSDPLSPTSITKRLPKKLLQKLQKATTQQLITKQQHAKLLELLSQHDDDEDDC